MIDSHVTGAYIARLRKERDWTQLELADRLHVTHQAVSRWETGDSFPDLATLAQLAQTFGVHMEALLDGDQATPTAGTARDEVLEALTEGQTERIAELAKANPSGMQTVVEMGPLTRPSVMNRIVESMAGYHFTLEQAVALGPFVSRELLDSIVAGIDEPISAQDLADLAPFVTRAWLGQRVQQLAPGSVDVATLESLAPFIDRPAADRLASGLADERITLGALTSLAPFISRATVGQLADRLIEEALSLDEVVSLAPFIERSRVEDLVKRVQLEHIHAQDLESLAPFMERQAFGELVTRIPVAHIDAGVIVSLAPFLDRPTLEALIRGQRQGASAASDR
jgi:transcriptional regulator with XRE-family HTH domain